MSKTVNCIYEFCEINNELNKTTTIYLTAMSSQRPNEITQLNKKIKSKVNKLKRLEQIQSPAIWDKIQIRLLRIELIDLKQQLQKTIDATINPNPNLN